jgi:muramoyltetrapeptide carboxypeptidase LdcA involved in peptidoglycan recycling
MMQLKTGDTIALVGNSNPQTNPQEIEQLCRLLQNMGVIIVKSPLLFDEATTNASKKATVLQSYFENTTIKAIFDISGGDCANSVLPYLDYEQLAKHPTPFFGYSDLTAVLNSLLGSQSTELFQLKTLLWEETGQQRQKFYETFFEGKKTLYDVEWEFVQGKVISGIVIGGNIRCFLKLAGTNYLPDVSNKVLFLESFGGDKHALFSMLHHVFQLPNIEQIKGILLGTFTSYQKAESYPIEQLVKDVLPFDVPIAKTTQIGHAKNSRALSLGKVIQLYA